MSSSSGYGFEVPKGLTELLQDFIVAVLRNKPSNLTNFAADYFSNKKNSQKNVGKSSDDSDRPRVTKFKEPVKAIPKSIPEPELFEQEQSVDKQQVSSEESSDSSSLAVEPPPRNYRRQSVAAESFDPTLENDLDDIKPIYPKTDEQRCRLTNICKKIMLFRCLEEEDMDDVINAMFEKKATVNEKIIIQGEDGDNFYIIDSGRYDVLVNVEGKNKKVFEFVETGSFGELALMYNTPRNATIVATTAGTLWAMDRDTFRKIVLKKAFQKRLNFENLLESVPLLKDLSNHERMSIADALINKVYQEGETIIKQGDPGKEMFFIEDGEVKIMRTTKLENGTEEEIFLSRLTKGAYFGELALLTKQPRAASVYAASKVKAAILDVQSFERLLGPCVELLKRNIDSYNTELKKITNLAGTKK